MTVADDFPPLSSRLNTASRVVRVAVGLVALAALGPALAGMPPGTPVLAQAAVVAILAVVAATFLLGGLLDAPVAWRIDGDALVIERRRGGRRHMTRIGPGDVRGPVEVVPLSSETAQQFELRLRDASSKQHRSPIIETRAEAERRAAALNRLLRTTTQAAT